MMNAKKHFFTAAVTTALVSMASVAPAQAFSKFGADGIMFDQDTTIEFDFGESGGLFRSELGVYEYELDADGNPIVGSGYNIFREKQAHDNGNGHKWDFDNGAWFDLGYPKGTCGITVEDCKKQFTFEAGKQYTLGLFNYHRTGGNLMTISYSNQELASMKQGGELTNGQLFLFGSWGSPNDTDPFEAKWGDLSNYAEGYSVLESMKDLIIGIDDSGNANDADYNDFKIIARKVDVEPTDVPEPTVLLGLGVVAGGMFLTRRNKSKVS